MLLTELHFDEWEQKYKDELLSILYARFYDTFKLSKEFIKDVIVSGSRVFRVKNRAYTSSSDLDVGILLDEKIFDEYFLPIEWMARSRLYLDQLKRDFPNKFEPKIKGFKFYGVTLSIFIRKWKGNDIFYNTFLNKYNLPYYSLTKNKYFPGNIRHLYDYLIHLKNRLNPYSFCFICCQEKEAPFIISIKVVDNFRKLDTARFDVLNQIYICEECYRTIFKTNSLDSLWETLNGVNNNTVCTNLTQK